MPTEPIRAPVGVNVPGLPMAGFQLTLHGRIWVTTEGYRSVNGKLTYRTIGEHPTITLDVARTKAQELDGMLAVYKKEGYKGPNPFTRSESSTLTLEKVAELYIERQLLLHAAHPEKAARNVRDTLSRYLSDWKQRELREITRADVLACHTRLGKGIGLTRKRKRAEETGRATANHTISMLRTIYKWAIDNELYVGSNPARLRKTEQFKDVERVRCLSPEELARLIAALAETSSDLRDFVLLSLATAQRKKTVLHARWSAIDLDAQTWTLESTETKNKEALTIELSQRAMQVLSQRFANRQSDWVFPGRDLSHPRFDFNAGTWRSLLKRAGLNYARSSPLNFRGHDLRHTSISYMVMAGRSLEQVGATVGHASVSSTQRYAHLMQQVQRETTLAGERQMQKMIDAAQQKQEGIRRSKLLESGRA